MEKDTSIKEGILQQFKDQSKLDAIHIDVVVQDGHVVLKGRADTEEEKELAGKIASSIPGVREVKNELHVDAGIIYTITSLVSGLSASNEHDLHKDKPNSDQ